MEHPPWGSLLALHRQLRPVRPMPLIAAPAPPPIQAVQKFFWEGKPLVFLVHLLVDAKDAFNLPGLLRSYPIAWHHPRLCSRTLPSYHLVR